MKVTIAPIDFVEERHLVIVKEETSAQHVVHVFRTVDDAVYLADESTLEYLGIIEPFMWEGRWKVQAIVEFDHGHRHFLPDYFDNSTEAENALVLAWLNGEYSSVS